METNRKLKIISLILTVCIEQIRWCYKKNSLFNNFEYFRMHNKNPLFLFYIVISLLYLIYIVINIESTKLLLFAVREPTGKILSFIHFKFFLSFCVVWQHLLYRPSSSPGKFCSLPRWMPRTLRRV